MSTEMRHRPVSGFSIAEALLAIFLIGIVLGMVGVLFQRSFTVLRMLDDKERARQASRMGLDRITSELREAIRIEAVGVDVVEFEKIDPNSIIEEPPKPPEPELLTDDFVPQEWTPEDAYPPENRLMVRYSIDGENLVRSVRRVSGGQAATQVVVVGVNSFTSSVNPDNQAEIDITLSVRDNRRVNSLSGRVMAPCILKEHEE